MKVSVNRLFTFKLRTTPLTGENVNLVHHRVHVCCHAFSIYNLRFPAAARWQFCCAGYLETDHIIFT